jgi:hypothetical protein
MTAVSPPTVATWLLKRLGRRERIESLMGDLWEEHQRRRSAAWYWRQVVTAMAVGACQDIRDHKVLAVRAILTASGFWFLETLLLGFVMRHFWNEFAWTMTLPLVAREPAFIVINRIVPAAGMGWIVGWLHRQHQAAMVLAVAVFALLPIQVPPLFPTPVPELLRRVANALNDPRYVPAFLTQLGAVTAVFVSVLLGGLSVPPDDERVAPDIPIGV